MTKFLCIGDPHVRLESLHLVRLMTERIRALELIDLDAIIVLGDVLHTHERLHTTSLNTAVKFIDFLATIAPTFVLVGNHDLENNQQFLTENHWMNALKQRSNNITIVDTVHRESDFVCCPYVPVGRFQEALNTCDNWKNAKLIFAHQEFKGCHMGAIVSTEGDAWNTTLPFVVSGHIHSNETLPEGVYYPGSSIQHAFGESTRNVVSIVTTTDHRVPHIEELDLQLPRKIILYKSVEEAATVQIPQDQHQYKVVLKGNHEHFKTFQKSTEYKKLTEQCKVVFKPIISELKDEDDVIDNIDNIFVSGFQDLVHRQVHNSADKYLYCIFEKIIRGNDLKEEDILVINKDEL